MKKLAGGNGESGSSFKKGPIQSTRIIDFLISNVNRTCIYKCQTIPLSTQSQTCVLV